MRWLRGILLVCTVIGVIAALTWRDLEEIGAGLLTLSAQEAQAVGKTAQALDRLTLAQNIAPHLPQPRSLAAYALAAQDPSIAARWLEGEFDSADPAALNNQAVLGVRVHSEEQRADLLRQASGFAHVSAVVYFNQGAVALSAGAFDEAEQALRRAAAQKADWSDPPLLLALTMLGQNGGQAQAKAAADAARLALSLDPARYEAHLALVHALWLLGMVDDGLSAVQTARQIFPEDTRLTIFHALFLRASGEVDAALVILRPAFFHATDNDLRRRISEEILNLMQPSTASLRLEKASGP